jgi:hypothetical protein
MILVAIVGTVSTPIYLIYSSGSYQLETERLDHRLFVLLCFTSRYALKRDIDRGIGNAEKLAFAFGMNSVLVY